MSCTHLLIAIYLLLWWWSPVATAVLRLRRAVAVSLLRSVKMVGQSLGEAHGLRGVVVRIA